MGVKSRGGARARARARSRARARAEARVGVWVRGWGSAHLAVVEEGRV